MRTLLLDASSAVLFVGALDGGAWLRMIEREMPAMEGLFEMAEEIFETFPLQSFARVALCEGPGRLMSLRIAAVAGNIWAQDKKKAVYNSLQLASAQPDKPAAYELRVGVVALWEDGSVKIVPAIPKEAVLLGSAVTRQENAALYASAIESFPKNTQTFLREVDFFDPPMFAPSSYALATNKIVSKEST